MSRRPRYPQGVSHTPTARRAVPWGHVRRPPFRTAVVLATLAVLAAVVAVLVLRGGEPEAPPPPPPPPANRIVPDGFIARLSTEALGQAPDQRAWRAATSYFGERGCTTASVQDFARRVYTGKAYRDLGYGAPERAITLYAGLLAREPDATAVTDIAAALRGDDAWDAVVDSVLSSAEFTTRIAPAICDATSPAYAAVAPTAPVDVGAGRAGIHRGPGGTAGRARRDAAGRDRQPRTARGRADLVAAGHPARRHADHGGRAGRHALREHGATRPRRRASERDRVLRRRPGPGREAQPRLGVGRPHVARAAGPRGGHRPAPRGRRHGGGVEDRGPARWLGALRLVRALRRRLREGDGARQPHHGLQQRPSRGRLGRRHQRRVREDVGDRQRDRGRHGRRDRALPRRRGHAGERRRAQPDRRRGPLGVRRPRRRSPHARQRRDVLLPRRDRPRQRAVDRLEDALRHRPRGRHARVVRRHLRQGHRRVVHGQHHRVARDPHDERVRRRRDARHDRPRQHAAALPMEKTACPVGPSASRGDGWASGTIEGSPKDQSLAGCIPQER